MTEANRTEDLVVRLRNYGDAVPGTLAQAKPFLMALEAAQEIERLRRELTEETRRSFQGARISYRGFSYGVGSQHGIDSLRRAIEGNGHG